MENKSLVGIKIIATLHIILSIVFSIATTFFLIQAIKLTKVAFLVEHYNFWLMVTPFIVAVFNLAISIVFFMIGKNLFKLKEWGRKSAFYLSLFWLVITCLWFFWALIRNDFRSLISLIIWGSIYSIVVYYLSRPNVKEQFK